RWASWNRSAVPSGSFAELKCGQVGVKSCYSIHEDNLKSMAVWVNDLRKMRERNLLYLFLALNVALAGAFIAYLFLSNSGQPEIVSTSFSTPGKTNLVTNVSSVPAVRPNETKTNGPVTAPTTDFKPGLVPGTNQTG